MALIGGITQSAEAENSNLFEIFPSSVRRAWSVGRQSTDLVINAMVFDILCTLVSAFGK